MRYRINRKTGDRISEIGIGSSYMFGAGMAEAVRALRRAVCQRCEKEGLGISVMKPFSGDSMAIEHYRTLEKNAVDCIGCCHCNSRCPFSVKQSERMQEIKSYMNRIS